MRLSASHFRALGGRVVALPGCAQPPRKVRAGSPDLACRGYHKGQAGVRPKVLSILPEHRPQSHAACNVDIEKPFVEPASPSSRATSLTTYTVNLPTLLGTHGRLRRKEHGHIPHGLYSTPQLGCQGISAGVRRLFILVRFAASDATRSSRGVGHWLKSGRSTGSVERVERRNGDRSPGCM
jgi:hypothetical protein